MEEYLRPRTLSIQMQSFCFTFLGVEGEGAIIDLLQQQHQGLTGQQHQLNVQQDIAVKEEENNLSNLSMGYLDQQPIANSMEMLSVAQDASGNMLAMTASGSSNDMSVTAANTSLMSTAAGNSNMLSAAQNPGVIMAQKDNQQSVEDMLSTANEASTNVLQSTQFPGTGIVPSSAALPSNVSSHCDSANQQHQVGIYYSKIFKDFLSAL